MTHFNASEIASSIATEFFQVGDDVRISQRGLSRLVGVSETAIRSYVNRKPLRTLEVEKALETSPGKLQPLRTLTISLGDAADVIEYYAYESEMVATTVKEQSASVFRAFAKRGIQAWVNDVLGMSIDATASNANINELLGLYPGLTNLTEQQTETMQAYISVRQYLTEVRGLEVGSEAFKWMQLRLPMMASQTYQSLKQCKPSERLVMGTHGYLCMLKTYLYSELPILDMAYDKLVIAFGEYQHFLTLDWVQMDGE